MSSEQVQFSKGGLNVYQRNACNRPSVLVGKKHTIFDESILEDMDVQRGYDAHSLQGNDPSCGRPTGDRLLASGRSSLARNALVASVSFTNLIQVVVRDHLVTTKLSTCVCASSPRVSIVGGHVNSSIHLHHLSDTQRYFPRSLHHHRERTRFARKLCNSSLVKRVALYVISQFAY